MEKLELYLTLIDIFLCVLDISLIIYLFFFKIPGQQKKRFFSRLDKRRSRVILGRNFGRNHDQM